MEDRLTVGELIEKLSKFPKSATVKINFGPAGSYHPDNSPILDIYDVNESCATHNVYLKARYDLVCSECGKSIQ